jgi:hypothetical protein
MLCFCVTSFFTDVAMHVVLLRGESRGILKIPRLNAYKEFDAKHRSDCLGKGADRKDHQKMQLIVLTDKNTLTNFNIHHFYQEPFHHIFIAE